MFDKAECWVQCDGELSNTFATNSGVLQGGVISPKLFTEYLIDINKWIDPVHGIYIDDTLISYLLYADDLVSFSISVEGLLIIFINTVKHDIWL